MRVVTAVATIAALSAGCSFAVNRPPQTVSAGAAPACTDSMTLPGLDFVIAGAAGLGGLAAGEDGAVLLGTGALFGLMGILGSSWVKDCRRKQAAFARLAGSGAVITRVKGGAPGGASEPPAEPELAEPLEAELETETETETEPAFEPKPLDEPAGPPPSPTPASAGAASNTCPAGVSCPAGLKCDPLRNQCVAAAELGTENQRCGRRDRCDAGLYCDLDRRVCLAGNLGLEGGACQTGARCAAGLECHAGVCVRRARRRATSSGSTRAKTATRPTRASGPRRPSRP